MRKELKESVHHGTEDYHFALYKMQNVPCIFKTSPHWHDEMEIVYVESGLLYLTIEDKEYLGRSGDIYIINPKEIHSMYFDSTDTNYMTILFSLSSLTFLNMDYSNRDFLVPLTEQKIGFVHTLTDTVVYESVRQSIHQMILLNQEKSYAYQLGTKVQLLQILYLLFSARLTVQMQSASKNRTLYRDILAYLKEHFTEDIGLTEVAEHFHMSKKYFSRLFKDTFHLTFVEYITRLRVEKADDLLLHTDFSVTEIAVQCGFSSCSYFNKRFKMLMGVTPGDYRK